MPPFLCPHCLRRPPTDKHSRAALRLPKRALGYAAAVVIAILALLPWGNKVETEQHYQAGFTPSVEVARQLFGEEKKVADTSTEATTKGEQGNLRWSTEQDGRYYIIIATERTEERIVLLLPPLTPLLRPMLTSTSW